MKTKHQKLIFTIFLLVSFFVHAKPAHALWYSSDWQYRRPITIQSSQVATTTTAFPVLATTTLSDLKTTTNGGKVQSDNGYDIVWTASDGTTILDYEQENYASTTGAITYWVEADISSTTDKVMYMYYGKPNASDLSNPTGVWDSNYLGVWHLGDATDSTSNNNDGTVYGTASTTSNSLIGNGYVFDGDADYISAGNLGSFPARGTIEFWANADTVVNYKNPFTTDLAGYNNGIRFEENSTNSFPVVVNYAGSNDIHIYVNNTFYQQTWYHIALTWDTGTSNIIGYLDGAEVFNDTQDNWPATLPDVAIGVGYDTSATRSWDGYIDETRISNASRHAMDILTEYNNQSDTSSFMTFGAEEATTWYNQSWRYRKMITIDASQVATTTTAFPVLATTTDTDLISKARSDGYDILFTSADGTTKLDYEIESYDSSTGKLVAWVETGVSSTTDTILYMYYGNAGASDQANPTGVWDADLNGDSTGDFAGVWHFKNDATASTTDSTTNGNDGVSFNGAFGTASGMIDGAFDFAASDDYVKISGAGSLMNSKDVTWTMWINTGETGNAVIMETEDGNNALHFQIVPGGNWVWGYSIASRANSGVGVSDSTWHYVTGTVDYSGQETKIYFDSIFKANNTSGSTLPTTMTDILLGSRSGLYNLTAKIDEVRASTILRPQGWITTEYNNQSSVGTFLTFASEESLPWSISDAPTTQGIRFKGGVRIKGGVRFK